jgi:N-acetylneuraminic acid mutarotase
MRTLILVGLTVGLGPLPLLACASGDDPGAPSPATDAGSSVDGGVHPDTGGGGDSTTECEPGFASSIPCGKCGTKTRTCSPAGKWSDYGACTGELADVECTPGDTRPKACGNCGTRTDTCDEKTCLWVNGTCGGEGECEAGSTDDKACTVAGEKQTRTCSSTCKWSDYSACAVAAGWRKMADSPLSARTEAAAVWTGTSMIVFGGTGESLSAKADGASYTLATDTWKTIAAAPSSFSKGRRALTNVWTGSHMIVWGGITGDSFYSNEGASYDPATDTWKPIATAPISARASVKAVWSTTTSEMLVWGGDAGAPAGDGAAYDPAKDTWRTLPAAPIGGRTQYAAVWSGTEMIVWGGGNGAIDGLKDGARFDPATNGWTKLPDAPASLDPRYQFASAFSGTELLVYGGYGGTDVTNLAKNTGARFDPAKGTWTAFTPGDDSALAPSARRYYPEGWTDGSKLFVFSGLTVTAPKPVSGGAIYDIATDKWSKMDATNAPGPRKDAIVVTTTSAGKETIVWGGSDNLGTYFADGAIYEP